MSLQDFCQHKPDRQPLVTVLMSAFNGEAYIAESIQSVLSQSHEDLQMLIVDDGSTDNTYALAASFQDTRLEVVRLPMNRGVGFALNFGLDLITSRYIAVLDQDDLCCENRLAEQVMFMEANPDLGFAGSHIETFGTKRSLVAFPTEHDDLKVSLLSYNPLAHSSVIFRADLFSESKLRYREAFKYCEDYDLWARASRCFRMANIPLPLVRYRRHEAQASTQYHAVQEMNARQIQMDQMEWLCDDLSPRERKMYAEILDGSIEGHNGSSRKGLRAFVHRMLTKNQVRKEIGALKEKILAKNQIKQMYSQTLLSRALDAPSQGPPTVTLPALD